MNKKIFAHIHIKEEAVGQFKEMVKPIIKQSNDEKGCLLYELYENTLKPGYFIFYEIFSSEEDFKLHCKQEHFKELIDYINSVKITDLYINRVI